jgi:hypothetical protein
MKTRLPALAVAALLLGGCAASEPDVQEVDLNLPTQEQADAAAKGRISSKNADAEMKDLASEIEGDESP